VESCVRIWNERSTPRREPCVRRRIYQLQHPCSVFAWQTPRSRPGCLSWVQGEKERSAACQARNRAEEKKASHAPMKSGLLTTPAFTAPEIHDTSGAIVRQPCPIGQLRPSRTVAAPRFADHDATLAKEQRRKIGKSRNSGEAKRSEARQRRNNRDVAARTSTKYPATQLAQR
jgi:hypothetical protein